jgi:Flp pilus assembly protein TadB
MKNNLTALVIVFIGFSMLTLTFNYVDNSKSAQKIENIERLYKLKTDLKEIKDRKEIQDYIDSTQILLDSLNNIN